MLTLYVWQSVSLNIMSKAGLHGASAYHAISQHFSALHWQRVNQYGCTPEMSNLKEKELLVHQNIDRTTGQRQHTKKYLHSFCAFRSACIFAWDPF